MIKTNKQKIIQQFMAQEASDAAELFVLHQCVCTASQQSEAEKDVLLLTEFPERLTEVLEIQWGKDVKRALSRLPCWTDTEDKDANAVFARYTQDLHHVAKERNDSLSHHIALIKRTIESPDTMGRFPSTLKQQLEQLIKL